VKCKNALGAGFRKHRKFEESVLDAIAAVAGITFPKQHPTGGKPHHLGVANNSLERCVGKPDGGRFGLRADLWLGPSRAGVPWYPPVRWLCDADHKNSLCDLGSFGGLPPRAAMRHKRDSEVNETAPCVNPA